MKVELTQKLKDSVKATAEQRYFPKSRAPNEEERKAAANFECGALLYAEIVGSATELYCKDINRRLTDLEKQMTNLTDSLIKLEAEHIGMKLAGGM